MTGFFETLGQEELDAATAKKKVANRKGLDPENFHAVNSVAEAL
jgi:hypothetical protein